MLFSLVYFLVRRLLGARGRRSDEKEVELLVLRHQVKVLQRQVKREGFNFRDSWSCGTGSMRTPLPEGAPCCSRFCTS